MNVSPASRNRSEMMASRKRDCRSVYLIVDRLRSKGNPPNGVRRVCGRARGEGRCRVDPANRPHLARQAGVAARPADACPARRESLKNSSVLALVVGKIRPA